MYDIHVYHIHLQHVLWGLTTARAREFWLCKVDLFENLVDNNEVSYSSQA